MKIVRNLIKHPAIIFALAGFFGCLPAFAYTTVSSNVLESNGSASDTQAAINAASNGYTVRIPAGSHSWTSGITISGKGIKLSGAGAGRVVARSTSSVAVGNGEKTFVLNAGG